MRKSYRTWRPFPKKRRDVLNISVSVRHEFTLKKKQKNIGIKLLHAPRVKSARFRVSFLMILLKSDRHIMYSLRCRPTYPWRYWGHCHSLRCPPLQTRGPSPHAGSPPAHPTLAPRPSPIYARLKASCRYRR